MAIDFKSEHTAWRNLTRVEKRHHVQQADAIREALRGIPEVADYAETVQISLPTATTDAQVRAYRSMGVMQQHGDDNGGFVMAMFQHLNRYDTRFNTLNSGEDLARLMFVGTYVSYREGRLEHDNGKPIQRRGLAEMLNVSRPSFTTFFGKLRDEGIIRIDEIGDIYVNPTVFYRGKVEDSPYYLGDYEHIRMYRKTIRDLYVQYNGRKLKQLALIYEVLPYINFATNLVCENPTERVTDRLIPMELGSLAEKLGRDSKRLKPALHAVKLDDKPVFMLAVNPHDTRSYRIIINPRVIFGGNAEQLQATKAYFN
ncbi:hypothetical protein [Paenibacillus sp. PL91]|uniref:hypothetical protein n=1 Tax=Paenibacillus sp. PL91 TaxID=2729538 RepID=UPI00145F4195|nr:hypothetical protein [Paenibacillus sp. PL91]MBC9199772.1 hypothetical protein [Paenibacillus sp. PL91]